MKTSEKGKELIKKFEGCELTTYRDPVGVLTIGYGHTKGVKEGDKITKKKAEELLSDDLERFESRVNYWSTKKYRFNQNEFDALVSFAFNLGNGNLDKLVKNGKRNRGEISDCILLYVKAGGKTLSGLVKRRKEERALFLTPENVSRETSEPVKEEIAKPTKKTNEEVAKEVIAGKWGNGNERKERLRNAGYNPTTIQRLVNQILKY